MICIYMVVKQIRFHFLVCIEAKCSITREAHTHTALHTLAPISTSADGTKQIDPRVIARRLRWTYLSIWCWLVQDGDTFRKFLQIQISFLQKKKMLYWCLFAMACSAMLAVGQELDDVPAGNIQAPQIPAPPIMDRVKKIQFEDCGKRTKKKIELISRFFFVWLYLHVHFFFSQF